MDALTPDELDELRSPIRAVCADRFDRSHVRESGEVEALDRDAWRTLAETGVLGVLAPAEAGGMDLGVAAGAALWEELGQGLAPLPTLWSALSAGHVDGVVDGERIVTGVIAADVDVRIVPHVGSADVVVVLGDTLEAHDASRVLWEPASPTDPLTPVGAVSALGAPVEVAGADVADRLRATGTVLTAAYLVGAGRLAVDLAVRHALDREQFGRPIGGFQAVKHLLANARIHLEVAAAGVRGAAAALDRSSGAVDREVASAFVVASDAAHAATTAAIQVHGGMGYTWEADPHLVWKRVIVASRTFGSPAAHAVAVASRLGAAAVA